MDTALKFLRDKIGKTGMLFISFFILGVYMALSYPKYIVTPDTLKETEQRINNRIDRIAARLELKTSETELSSLRKEKYELEALIDVPKPKVRYITRLKDVVERIKELETDKRELIKVLQDSK